MTQLGILGQMGCLNVRQLRTSRGTSAPQLGTAAASAGAGNQSQHRSLSMWSGLPYTMAAPGGAGSLTHQLRFPKAGVQGDKAEAASPIKSWTQKP